VELDHVLIAVADLEAAAAAFDERFGLASVEGGRHGAWGTANRIVPLGANYIELVGVVDEAVAAESTFGRWIAEGASPAGRPIGWAVRTDALDDVAKRLGLTVTDGSRKTPSGELLRWRSAGVEQAIAYPALPFFIEWGPGTALPGTTAITHAAAPVAISRLDLDGDRERVDGWLADDTLPLVVRDGRPRLTAVRLRTAWGEVVLSA
jgi:Glyoxalase-like domain